MQLAHKVSYKLSAIVFLCLTSTDVYACSSFVPTWKLLIVLMVFLLIGATLLFFVFRICHRNSGLLWKLATPIGLLGLVPFCYEAFGDSGISIYDGGISLYSGGNCGDHYFKSALIFFSLTLFMWVLVSRANKYQAIERNLG